MSKVQKVAVVGAGIGGLNAAIALIQRGFDVTVYEQADALGEIGAGIQLSPNASRVLMALGLDKDFEAIAFEPNRHVVRNWKSGGIVSATQMKGVFRPQYGAGYFGAHRADLHAVLQRRGAGKRDPPQRQMHRRDAERRARRDPVRGRQPGRGRRRDRRRRHPLGGASGPLWTGRAALHRPYRAGADWCRPPRCPRA